MPTPTRERPSGSRGVRVKRVYEPAERSDGARILVDRLWPRGVRKQDLAFDAWMKDVAPSTGLRKWYGHQPERFEEFARRYRQELASGESADAFDELRHRSGEGPLTLLTATRDVERSGALVLAEALQGAGSRRRRRKRASG
ncbi:MAG: DUF488 domain-containing protein [Actinomycetota bacterium]